MEILKDKESVQIFSSKCERENRIVAFVPTMGGLHNGHLELVNVAKQYSSTVLVSIFVNPKQFAPNEDLEAYPRTVEADLMQLKSLGVSAVYLPSINDIYPPKFTCTVDVGPIGQILEGQVRPHFFNGVATVVLKLFVQTKAKIALFGEKDFQQLHIIKQLVCDFDLPIKIVGIPIMRDLDGLALSTRNAYLSPLARRMAVGLYQTLQECALNIKAGMPVNEATSLGQATLLAKGFSKVDYFEIRDSMTLEPIDPGTIHKRLLAAAWLDNIRLLDNYNIC